MLVGAIVAFVLAAGGGLIMLTMLLKDRQPPRIITVVHGLAALTGIGLLVAYIVNSIGDRPTTSLIIFIIAALGGLTILALDLQKRRIPRGLLVLHPLIAAIGLVLLIIFVTSM